MNGMVIMGTAITGTRTMGIGIMAIETMEITATKAAENMVMKDTVKVIRNTGINVQYCLQQSRNYEKETVIVRRTADSGDEYEFVLCP
jgi:predicted regulator of amino acid metabolism with ACT domain